MGGSCPGGPGPPGTRERLLRGCFGANTLSDGPLRRPAAARYSRAMSDPNEPPTTPSTAAALLPDGAMEGRVVVVTGGGTGLGLEISRGFAALCWFSFALLVVSSIGIFFLGLIVISLF